MGITRLTALIIATRGDDIKVSSAYDFSSNKWVGWITLGEEDRYRPLLDSGPHYNSAEEAETGMKMLIVQIREGFDNENQAKDRP